MPATSVNFVFMVLDVFNLPALTLNGNPPPLFGMANLRMTRKMTKKMSNGQTSLSSDDRRDFSLNFTSTMTLPVMDIHRSLSEVSKGFLVSKIFTYCSVRLFWMLMKETELQVPKSW